MRATISETRALWRSGGVTFAASPRDYSQKVNRKMYRGALRSILSELLRTERLMPISDFRVDAPKSKALAARLHALGLKEVLIVTDQPEENLYLAARNLPGVEVRDVTEIDPLSLVGSEKVLMTAQAVKRLEERLS